MLNPESSIIKSSKETKPKINTLDSDQLKKLINHIENTHNKQHELIIKLMLL